MESKTKKSSLAIQILLTVLIAFNNLSFYDEALIMNKHLYRGSLFMDGSWINNLFSYLNPIYIFVVYCALSIVFVILSWVIYRKTAKVNIIWVTYIVSSYMFLLYFAYNFLIHMGNVHVLSILQ